MKRFLLGFLVAALLAPVFWRMSKWERTTPQTLDPADVAAGKELFNHVFVPNDPLTKGDGVGPVFNAASCVACHYQGGAGGSGKLAENVTTYLRFDAGNRVVGGTLHAEATNEQSRETMNRLQPGLPNTSRPTLEMVNNRNNRFGGGVIFSQRNTPALFGAKLIDEINDRDIVAIARRQQAAAGMSSSDTESSPVGRALYTKGRVGKFGWKAQTASLLDFVQGACANELGLSNPNQPQPTSIATPDYKAPGQDLTLKQCEQMAAFIASLPAPRRETPEDKRELELIHRGEKAFGEMGCAVCHTPNVGTVYGIYSDLLVHRMGSDLVGEGSYNAPSPSEQGDPESTPLPDEWRTPPLWGVADSAPYLHDGRAGTLEEAIAMHGGQGAASARNFQRAPLSDRNAVVAFLKSLRAPN
jgi:CxxC motif-containing protein (DUF1111 family)